MTKEEVREYLSGQLWDREINEFISNVDITHITQKDLAIRGIMNNAYDLAEYYIDEHISDEIVKQFINYEEFGQYLAQEDDILTYFESSGRIVEWEC